MGRFHRKAPHICGHISVIEGMVHCMGGGHISLHKAVYIYDGGTSIHMHGDIVCMAHSIYAHKEHVGKKMDTPYYMGGNYWHSFQNKDAHREGNGYISPGMENAGDPADIVHILLYSNAHTQVSPCRGACIFLIVLCTSLW